MSKTDYLKKQKQKQKNVG